MKLIFVSHSTTRDNELEKASGYNDVELSETGLEQVEEMRVRYKDTKVAAVYCSDLQRSYLTGEKAFGSRGIPVYRDARLRECDYGVLTQAPMQEIKAQRAARVSDPFPGGESYEDACRRVKSALDDMAAKHDDEETIFIVGHRATQYGIECALKGVTVLEAVTAPWSWQPGWVYELPSTRPAQRNIVNGSAR